MYGNDYVVHIADYIRDLEVINIELDMLCFDLDMTENILSDIPEEDAKEFDDEEHDEYEFEDVDPEIFDDPILMIKWLPKLK